MLDFCTENIVRIAVCLQWTPGGLPLEDIQDGFSVGRKTVERMRDPVGDVFGSIERVDTGDAKHHWRLRSDAVRRHVAITPEELAELESAASVLERAGFKEPAGTLRELATKLRAKMRPESRERIESDLEALMQAVGLAVRAGPRLRLDGGPLSARYAHLCEESPSFNGEVPFDAWLFEPFSPILRLRLPADRMVRNRALGVSEAKVVLVVPDGNRAYRERVTSPSLDLAFPDRKARPVRTESAMTARTRNY